MSIVSLVNKPEVYDACTISSTSSLKEIIEYIPIYNPNSGSTGLNRGFDEAKNDLVICCHQDIYYMDGWFDKLNKCLSMIEKDKGKWGVCGMAGTTFQGLWMGSHVKDVGLSMYGHEIHPVQTLDCSTLILSKDTCKNNELRFDENLKYFHMYGEDICLQANDKGLGVYVINVPIDHRSSWAPHSGFYESRDYMIQKWRPKFKAINTTCGCF